MQSVGKLASKKADEKAVRDQCQKTVDAMGSSKRGKESIGGHRCSPGVSLDIQIDGRVLSVEKAELRWSVFCCERDQNGICLCHTDTTTGGQCLHTTAEWRADAGSSDAALERPFSNVICSLALTHEDACEHCGMHRCPFFCTKVRINQVQRAASEDLRASLHPTLVHSELDGLIAR